MLQCTYLVQRRLYYYFFHNTNIMHNSIYALFMNGLRNIGVIGDMVGFASAIYQRGVNFIQVCIGECVFN